MKPPAPIPPSRPPRPPGRGLRAAALGLGAALGLVLGPGLARADIYSWTDADGTVHVTNVKPRAGGKWKKVMTTAPDRGSKAAAERGDCARCDVVPSRDRSPDRFSRYDEFIHEASALYMIPVPLIRAVIKVESDYDPRVVSSMGARGLMQVMPAVQRDMGINNVHDPRENILAGTRMLRVLANRYDGDLVLTIAGYHAGMGSLARYGNTVPPYEHTRLYLRMVLDRYYDYKAKHEATLAAGR
ncbi:MAG: lytic transglycosylase domain-containing protein [Kofleriaceae bacterium]|jgi:soluble lytic murein transglycosylase-like protein|nr:lytic transglycosylase domain-containing protein [Kofleriaceae bacterium]MBP9204998.1 lytic transglycosylase domain-containing protein [Kofleriaceae bacterium]